MKADRTGVQRLDAPDIVVPAEAEVGEGPVFDPRTGRLCWVDITRGELHEDDLETGESTTSTMSTLLGAAVPRAQEAGFAVAVADGLGVWAGGELNVVEPVLPERHRRMNDAKCDSRGRLWAGSTHMEFEPGVGALHRWDGVSPSTVVTDGFALPNGLGWSPDDRTMYLVDSIARTLLAASFDAGGGDVGDFAPLCAIDAGLPDGMSVDVDGCLWVAVWGGSEVQRISPAGKLLATVPLPVTQPSSCTFGENGTLYITSARAGLSEGELAAQPHAGSIFALASGTHGVPVSSFEG